MKAFVFLLLGSSCCALAQNPATVRVSNATQGACSPIAPNNTGSITIKCSGFSDKENEQILRILKGLSSDQAKEQESILSKLEEVLKTVKSTQRLALPRTVSNEARDKIYYFNLSHDGPQQALVIAPQDDKESAALASQVRELIETAGWSVAPVIYEPIEPSGEQGYDVSVALADIRLVSGVRYYADKLKNVLHAITDLRTDPALQIVSIDALPGRGSRIVVDPTRTIVVKIFPKSR